MDDLKDFKISFSGLELGHHSFEFQIDDKFFNSFESSRIQEGKLQVNIDLLKQETMLQLDFKIKGEVLLDCDRCLDRFLFPIETTELLLVRFGQETHEESESILIIGEKEYQVDVSQYIYEYISLSIPIKVVHPDLENGESGCNQEFLKNFDLIETNDKEEVDPRWDALKKLIKE